MTHFSDRTVWIIGASSGIGHALAIELDRRGASLILSARKQDALENLNAQLGGRHKIIPIDAADQDAFSQAFENIGKLDSVIYLAAVYTPSKIENIKPEDVTAALSTNLQGAFSLLHHLIPFYKRQGHGQIALCGSVAGYAGLPNGQPYSATKAAIINLAESLRGEMAGKNIDVRVINPGFVKTPLTDKNKFQMPMMIQPEEAAREIAGGLSGSSFEIHFPKKFTRLVKFLRLLPYPLFFALAKKLNG